MQGKVALSGYRCDLLEELYGDWRVIEAPAKYAHSIKQLRTEVLWVNYTVEETREWQAQQISLDQRWNESLAI